MADQDGLVSAAIGIIMSFREIFLKKNELRDYYLWKRASEYQNKTHTQKYKIRSFFHPVLHGLIKLNRLLVERQSISVIGEKISYTEKPVIFAVTHIGKFDYQIVTEVLKVYQIPFSGDPEKMYRTFEGFILWLNGVIYCDTDNMGDRKVGYHTMVNTLRAGYNVLIYPEGVWNISPNQLVLPLFPGVIKCADETGCEIIPIGIVQQGKEFYVRIGENLHIDSSQVTMIDKEVYLDYQKTILRDVMATLQYELMSSMGTFRRAEIGEYECERKKYVKEKLLEWCDGKTKEPYYSEELISSRVFRT